MQSERSEERSDLREPAPALPRGREQREDTTPRGAALAHVLVCLDRSAAGESAVAHAAELALAFEAKLTLLHAIESRGDALEPADALGWEITRAESQQYLERLKNDLAGRGLEASTVLAQGPPAEQIVAAAAEGDVDLIVLSSHGERPASDWNLGGTAEKVTARAAASVLIVPPEGPVESTACDHVLIPLDGSQRAECVLPTALGLARATRATIGLVHVVREPELFRTTLPSAGDLELVENLSRRNYELAGRYLDGLAARLGAEGIEVRVFLERGDDIHRVVNDLAEREHVDLIALAAHGRTGAVTRSYGSLPSQLIDDRSRPLLVIQDLPAAAPRRRAAQVVARSAPLRSGRLHHDLKP
jgi:nucleotide-binding universal stress UspA family protein